MSSQPVPVSLTKRPSTDTHVTLGVPDWVLHEGDAVSEFMNDRGRAASFRRIKAELRSKGLLPFTDLSVPSVVSLVAGAPVAGSWWGHPAGPLIYEVAERLESDPEVEVVKLWNRKRTLVHRRLWPALSRVGQSRSAWQMEGLDDGARRLLAQVEKAGVVRGDEYPSALGPGTPSFRPSLRQLEDRLLVLTGSVHTDSGAHAVTAESWPSWRIRRRVPPFDGPVKVAEQAIEAAAPGGSTGPGVSRRFPWGLPARSRSR
jgi:hypothetical protein